MITVLTKRERLSAYYIMYAEYRPDVVLTRSCPDAYGLCYLIADLFNLSQENYNDMECYFPELYSKRPAVPREGGYWFPLTKWGRTKRSKLLLECIMELEAELNNNL